jgi:hypothetical protein
MTDEQLAAMHRLLAEYHRRLSKEASINFGETLNSVAPDLLEESKFELEWIEEPRRLSEILEHIDELIDKVWYNRHWNRRIAKEEGRTQIVEKETFPVKDHSSRPIQRDIWEGALKAAKKVETKDGIKNLGPWDVSNGE